MNIIEQYLEQETQKIDNENENEANNANSQPCKLCESTKFIQLYRNVVGEIEGKICGHFSLFGGSITGHIDGYTKTLPVLSCSNCKNERLIKTWNYTYEKEFFWEDMHEFYFGIDNNELNRLKDIKQIYLNNPIATRNYMLDNENYNYNFYNDIPYWSTEIWAKAGFKINKIKKRFLFWEREIYPNWN